MARSYLRGLIFGVPLAGCSLMSVRGQAPVWTSTGNKSLNASVSCVIAGLNSVEPGTLTYSAQIIEPERVFEVTPQQTLTIGAEIYFVRLTALSATTTKIDLNSAPGWTARLKNAIAPCAK